MDTLIDNPPPILEWYCAKLQLILFVPVSCPPHGTPLYCTFSFSFRYDIEESHPVDDVEDEEEDGEEDEEHEVHPRRANLLVVETPLLLRPGLRWDTSFNINKFDEKFSSIT